MYQTQNVANEGAEYRERKKYLSLHYKKTKKRPGLAHLKSNQFQKKIFISDVAQVYLMLIISSNTMMTTFIHR